MSSAEETAAVISQAGWPERIALIRRIPEQFGTAHQATVYSTIARMAYVPHLTPDFGYVHWRDEYELPAVESAYKAAFDGTYGFTRVDIDSLTAAIQARPSALRAFRLLLGFTAHELSAACGVIAARDQLAKVTVGRIKSMEEGRPAKGDQARTCASTIDAAMTKTLLPPATATVRSKLDKPDTRDGWNSVQEYAREGVPFPVYLTSTSCWL